ncbi:hypothetical protein TTHERM_00004820 (macronuclear) [Tetrahymena thermophila SB210]|uniref:Uncharacterized protein n=1 Tax=Tetrahymena thermophila (strain SB210) TaxID=312017 RepID=Q22SF2_TETTS|nr:hypothetical protein TTHERM_00004820 [Tetrahymena thermophila SB210]EAR87820.2 hypothetical protein TTHERM_00004820 [Tetrahymena thermophila SB210]|eukprot:XP_001008065.2 hypothetical protein TTHERM_00004820 [Tetrahymena thermophila SB210]
MDYFIDKYEQLEQTNRLLENIEAKLNSMNVPQLDNGQIFQNTNQHLQKEYHPIIDNYLLSTNAIQENTQDKSRLKEFPTIQMSTQVLQDDLLISGYDQFKSGQNQYNSALSFAQTNSKVGNSNGGITQWQIQEGNNVSKTVVNTYQSTEKINNLLLGESESQVIDSDPKRMNFNSNQKKQQQLQQQQQQESSQSSSRTGDISIKTQNSNTLRTNRSKSLNKSQANDSQFEEQAQISSSSKIDKNNIQNISSKSSSRNKHVEQKNKIKKMYIGSGQKEQLIKIEENNLDEDELDEENSNSSPFIRQKNGNQMATTQNYSPISLEYTKSLNNTQNIQQNNNMLFSMNRGDNNFLKNNSQLEDELNTLRNRLYLINDSYTKLAQQQSLSDYEVQNSQRKIYSLAQQMKDLAESLQGMNQLQLTQTAQLNSGYRFENENNQASSGKKGNKLSADKYEDIIIDDKVFLLEKENRRLKKENQMLKEEIEDYKEKINRLFHEHQNTRQSLEKHIELKYETQILNIKEAQKIIINEKESKIQILQKQLEDLKNEKESMKKELFSFRQSIMSQRINTSSLNNHHNSFENKQFEQPFLANNYFKTKSYQENKDSQNQNNQSMLENSVLSQNYAASNSYLDQKRQNINNNLSNKDTLKFDDKKQITQKPISIQDYVRTDIDSNLLKNNKKSVDSHQQNQKKRIQSTEYLKTERNTSKEKQIHNQKPPKLKKNVLTVETSNGNNTKKSRSKSPINYNEQIQYLIKQNENLNKLKAQLRTESSLSNSRKETHTSLLSNNNIQNKKQKKISPKRSKSSVGHRASIKM